MKQILRKCGVAYGFALLLSILALVLFVHLTGVELPVGRLLFGMLVWAVLVLVLEQREWIFFPLLLILLGLVIFFRAGGFKTYDVPPALPWLAFLVLMTLLWGLAWLLRWFGVRLVVSLLLVVGWITAALGVWYASRAIVVLAAPLPLFTLMEILHFKSPERSRNAVPLLCVSVLFSLILAVVPVSNEPYPYKWVRRAWNGIEELWEKIETQLFYRSEKGTAFSMDFNGEATPSSTTKAKEKSEQRLKVWLDFGDACVLYLPGTTMDYFDGKSWSDHLEDSAVGEVFNWQYDTAEHIYALWRRDRALSDGTISEDVFRQRRTDLTYSKMETKTLFSTPGLLRIQVDEDRYPYHDHAGNVQFDYQQKKDCYYILYFLEENSEQVEEVIRAVEGYEYDADQAQSWGQVSGSYADYFLLRLVQTVQIEQALAKRMDVINSLYLQLPEDLPPVVTALAEEITVGCATDYDAVRAIENYLHENYQYARNPSMPGKGETMLEHLIDTKEGYCTWFATAACVMLRSQGIPTRFVQGYRTVLRGQTRMYLDEDDQHAWCEAYIQGYGWITVEASPGFAASRAAWEVQQQEEEQEEEELIEEEGSGEEFAEEETSVAGPLLWIVLGLAALAVGGFFLVRFQLQKRRYERMSYNDRCEADLRQVLTLLEKRHYVRYPYETLRVFFEKVPWESFETDNDTVRAALQAFEDAVFGPDDLDESGWQAGQALIQALKQKPKKRRYL